MAGFCGIVGDYSSFNTSVLSHSIDLLNNHVNKGFKNKEYYFEISYKDEHPLVGDRFYEDEELVFLFHGDYVDYKYIDWNIIAGNVKKETFSYFSELSGIFSFFGYNKIKNKCYLISDNRSQDPVFYYHGKDYFIFSTDLSTFSKILRPEVNEEWIFEYYFFNFPVSNKTPIENVYRLGYAEIVEYNKGIISIKKYNNLLRKSDILLSGNESFELAERVFNDRIPNHYSGASKIACTLTGGWDARTCLAYAPDLNKVTAYTYGIPGTQDLVIAANFARKINIKHEEIHFDNDFVNSLPEFMIKSVYLSSGMNHIGRSSLVYTYEELKKITNSPLVITGIQLDQVFRGHAAIPPSVSYGMAKLINSENISYEDYGFRYTDDFRKYIDGAVEDIIKDMGSLQSNQMHLLYLIYITAVNLFAGEIKIADHHTTIRVPAWDNEILRLAFKIKESTLSYSQLGNHRRGDWPEMVLIAYLLNKKRPQFAKIPVGYSSPKRAINGKFVYEASRYINYIKNIFMLPEYRKKIPLEDNNRWFNVIHREFIDNLVFSNNSNVKNYFRDDYLMKLKETREKHYLMKLVTLEIIIRLIEDNWNYQKVV